MSLARSINGRAAVVVPDSVLFVIVSVELL